MIFLTNRFSNYHCYFCVITFAAKDPSLCHVATVISEFFNPEMLGFFFFQKPFETAFYE
jgi:hypothetical protein